MVADLATNPQTSAYLQSLSQIANLNERLLPRAELWVGLREPCAGELIIPRKLRIGHRVHINPFTFRAGNEGKRLRVSSNFISYNECICTDLRECLNRETATRLIAAFLLSSFGQLQFEMEGYNREGALALEKANLKRIRIFDPRWIDRETRTRILESLQDLPYPISTAHLSSEQPQRNALDELFAVEIARRLEMNAAELRNEVHSELDAWIVARAP